MDVKDYLLLEKKTFAIIKYYINFYLNKLNMSQKEALEYYKGYGYNSINNLFKNQDCVVHLASRVGGIGTYVNHPSEVFNTNIEIHIIPHLNLKSSALNSYIPKRQELVRLLESICTKFQIKFHDIGKFLETLDNPDDKILEIYMRDSTHFSYGYTFVKSFLVDRIYPDLLN